MMLWSTQSGSRNVLWKGFQSGSQPEKVENHWSVGRYYRLKLNLNLFNIYTIYIKLGVMTGVELAYEKMGKGGRGGHIINVASLAGKPFLHQNELLPTD